MFAGYQLTITDTVAELYNGNRVHVATRRDYRTDDWGLTQAGKDILNPPKDNLVRPEDTQRQANFKMSMPSTKK